MRTKAEDEVWALHKEKLSVSLSLKIRLRITAEMTECSTHEKI